MKWHYDLNHAEPIIRDEFVADAQGASYISSVTINPGALMSAPSTADMIATAGTNGAPLLSVFKLAYNATINSAAQDSIGICMERPYGEVVGMFGTANTTATSYYGTAGCTAQASTMAKCIINPGAVYLAEHILDASNTQTVSALSSITLRHAAVGMGGYFVYFPATTGTTTGVKGSLRYIYTVTNTTCSLSGTLTGTAVAGTDRCAFISPRGFRAPQLTADSTKVTSTTAPQTGPSTNLIIVEAYIDRDQGLEVMKPYVHGILDNLHLVNGGNGPKIYYDLVMKSHVYGNSI